MVKVRLPIAELITANRVNTSQSDTRGRSPRLKSPTAIMGKSTICEISGSAQREAGTRGSGSWTWGGAVDDFKAGL